MKILIAFFLLSLTFNAFAQYSSVYCASYTSRDGSRSGYSLYRQYDGMDIGNAFFSDFYECLDA